MQVPHDLGKEEALSRIKGMLGKLKQEQQDKISNLEEEWKGDGGTFQFTTQGFDLSGTLRVHDSYIDIDATIPFVVSLFSGKIKEMIEKKAGELLASK